MTAATTTNPHAPALPYFETRPFDLDSFVNPPVKYVSHATLACTPARLWEILEDGPTWSKWALGIADVEWTSPRPFGVGTTRTVRFTGGMEVYERFIAWDRGRELAFTFTGITQPVWYAFGEHYLVEDLGNGRCRLTWTVAYEPRDVLATIQPFVRPLFALAFRTYMKRLERVAATWAPRR